MTPNYNVMGPAKAALEATARQLAFELGPDGIRVNCLSPGPMNTVSARGIPGISVSTSTRWCRTGRHVDVVVSWTPTDACVCVWGVQRATDWKRMRKYSEEHSPLRRNATPTEVGNMAALLASEMASAITGQTIYGTDDEGVVVWTCGSMGLSD